MVMVASPLFFRAMGTIRLLPTSTVPKLVLGTENGVYVPIALEIEESETSRRLQETSLRGEPRQFMSVAFVARAQ
jgi:hypothetical protein